MQLSINDCDVDLDVLNDYADLLQDLFDALTNIFYGVYYPTSY